MAGRAADAYCTASPLSAREGERWRGVRRGVAGNLTVQWGQHCSCPHPLGGGEHDCRGVGRAPTLQEKRGGLLTTVVSSELDGG
jgi:hypothetical protein